MGQRPGWPQPLPQTQPLPLPKPQTQTQTQTLHGWRDELLRVLWRS